MSDLFRRLAGSSDRDLEGLMRASASPDLGSITGYQWRGYNTAIATVLIGNRKFIKVFFDEPRGVRGHNYLAVGTNLDEPWQRRGGIVGRYRVTPSGGFAHPRYGRAALIDYGRHREQSWFLRTLRDYLVQPEPADADVLLGKAYFAFGGIALPAGYFILGRLAAYSES